TAFPMFHALTDAANPAFAAARESAPVTVVADPGECSVQFDPVGQADFVSSCDIAKSALASRGVSYTNETAPAGALAAVVVGSVRLDSVDGVALGAAELAVARATFETRLRELLEEAGYPAAANPAAVNVPLVTLLILLMVTFSTMVY